MENANNTTTNAPQTLRAHYAGRCHKCEVAKIAEKMRRGEAVDDATACAARDACAKCKGAADDSRQGISWVHLGAMATPHIFLANQTAAEYREALEPNKAETLTPLEKAVEAVARELIEAFRNLNLRQLQGLHGLLNGKTLSQTANDLGITKQALSKWMSKIPQTRAVAAFVHEMLHTNGGRDAQKKARMFAMG